MQQKIILPKRRKDSIFNRNSPLFVARLSFLVSVLIALMTFLLGWLEDSLFYKANGLIALTDIVNSAILLTAVAHSNREPDSFFNYGYGKYESFGIFVSSSLITFNNNLHNLRSSCLVWENRSNWKLHLSYSFFPCFCVFDVLDA